MLVVVVVVEETAAVEAAASGPDLVGTWPVDAAWGRVGGAPCLEREKAFILARIS